MSTYGGKTSERPGKHGKTCFLQRPGASGEHIRKHAYARGLSGVLLCIAALLTVVLFTSAFLHFPAHGRHGKVQKAALWQMDGRQVTLPADLHDLQPRTRLILTAQVDASEGDYIYLKSVYMPLKLYVDGELIFTCGQPGSYPSFLLDPPTQVKLLPLQNTGHPVTITMELLSPSQRTTASIYPLLVGKPDGILRLLFSQMGSSLIFSIILLAIGLILGLLFLVLIRFEEKGIAFLWLGLFSLCTGFWLFGECNLTGIFVENSTLLYFTAFTGLFSFAIPLMRFGIVVLELHNNNPLQWMCIILEAAIGSAMALQLLGIASLSRTMYVFHVLVPLSLLLFMGCTLVESFHHQNKTARRFCVPFTVLALFAVLELGNYYCFHLNVQKSFFFQLGVLIFIFYVSIICGYYIRDSFALRFQNQQLSYEISLMEKQVDVQKERYQLLSDTSSQIRQQRHDLKHHLTVIRSCLDDGEYGKLTAYLDELSAKIPEEPYQSLSGNEAVNAVALYYQSAAHRAGIHACSVRLHIPPDTGRVSDNELCVIVGNLLENAVTACHDLENPFIRLQSRFTDGILTITMDNSCRHCVPAPGGTFRSQKPGGGIGLRSVRSVAEKYGGGCRFVEKDGVFSSSVYLYL